MLYTKRETVEHYFNLLDKMKRGPASNSFECHGINLGRECVLRVHQLSTADLQVRHSGNLRSPRWRRLPPVTSAGQLRVKPGPLAGRPDCGAGVDSGHESHCLEQKTEGGG